jgi:hypothetical protein
VDVALSLIWDSISLGDLVSAVNWLQNIDTAKYPRACAAHHRSGGSAAGITMNTGNQPTPAPRARGAARGSNEIR